MQKLLAGLLWKSKTFMLEGKVFSCALLLILFLPFSVVATAAPITIEMMQAQDPGAETWNAVRGREEADTGDVRTQVRGVDSNVLINRGGDQWRFYRMDVLIPIAAKVLGFVVLAILVFRLGRGKIPISSGRSDKKIKRFSTFQRYVHWITAILFVGLSITGIALMFGRHIIMPLMGKETGGTFMLLMKQIHDFSGPAFAIALVVLAITFIKGNFAHVSDMKWILKGGGLLGKHASAGRYNAGEKIWYWAAVIVGGAVVVSGLVLNMPNFPQISEIAVSFLNIEPSRNTMTYYHWIHSISTVIIMAVAMGHIYMGTVAMEGAFEVMQTGYCDANWAKEHHDLWYEEMVEAGEVLPNDPEQEQTT